MYPPRPAILALILLMGCTTSDKADDSGGGWDDDGSEEADVGTCEDTLRITGQFKMGTGEFPIDESIGEGLTFSTEHKIDIDLFEAGCISDITLEIKQGGLGCNIDLGFAATGAGAFALSSFGFSADSYCPNFSDDLEGEYSTTGPVPLSVTGLPSQVEMETGTEETVCLDDIDFRFGAEGTLQQEGGSTERAFELSLNLSGDYWSTGSTSADCEVIEDGGGGETGGDDGGGSETGGDDGSETGGDDGGETGGDDGGETGGDDGGGSETGGDDGGETGGDDGSETGGDDGGDDGGETGGDESGFASVSAGEYHTCGVTSSDTVSCWGNDDYGQASPPAGSFASVSAGGFHNCGITSSDTVSCWGGDGLGQASPPAGSFASVSAGNSHTCGITSSGTVSCWGNDDYGQASPP